MSDIEHADPDDDAPAHFSTSAVADALLGLTDAELDDITRRQDFVEKLARGYGPVHAGLAVGWSLAQIKSIQAEDDMIEIMRMVEEFNHDTVEFSILQSARAGNAAAQKMYAMAKMPQRGWVERKTHVIEGQARVDVVHSVRQALLESLGEPGAVGALHAAAIEAEAAEG